MTHEEVPLLAWEEKDREGLISARFDRLRRRPDAKVVGDVASFYLPYLDVALDLEPSLWVICLERPREEVIDSFSRWLETVQPLPTNHWSAAPADGVYHDPVWSRIFPKYPETDLATCIGRYWDEYHNRVSRLTQEYPDRVRCFPTDSLNSDKGVRDILSFAGFTNDEMVVTSGERANEPAQAQRRRLPNRPSDSPQRCVVLVPYQSHIVPRCESSLKELERRGYTVRRISGYANIDQGRSQMATDALWDGFEETLWIDSDVGFDADDVEKLRRHQLPIVCGIYPKKGQRSLAAHVLPGTKQLTFGAGGGLTELRYAATGFLLVRRRVYETMQTQLRLPVCNERFGKAMVPFFEPMSIRDGDGYWNLGEDYAFCHRARECGFSIMADTSIRLWHVGTYAYGWEDAGIDRERFGTFRFNLNDGQ
ncbi:MAG: hypothetical protein ACK5Q5_03120 [Planctomycetaceae bacterium]